MPEIELLVLVIAILVEVVFKKALKLRDDYCPLVAVILGIGFSYLGTSIDAYHLIVDGVITGLAAMNLWPAMKATGKITASAATRGLSLLNRKS